MACFKRKALSYEFVPFLLGEYDKAKGKLEFGLPKQEISCLLKYSFNLQNKLDHDRI